VPVSTYNLHENSGRGIMRNAVRYALFFKVSLDWMITGRGAPRGRSEAERLIEELPTDALPQVVEFMKFVKERGRRS